MGMHHGDMESGRHGEFGLNFGQILPIQGQAFRLHGVRLFARLFWRHIQIMELPNSTVPFIASLGRLLPFPSCGGGSFGDPSAMMRLQMGLKPARRISVEW